MMKPKIMCNSIIIVKLSLDSIWTLIYSESEAMKWIKHHQQKQVFSKLDCQD